jgi:hypothetical protein
MSYQERLERELREMAEPLIAQMREIDRLIEERTNELAELREHAKRLLVIARAVDPEQFAPKPQRNRPAEVGVSEETLQRFHAWLLDNSEEINAGTGVYSSGLYEDPNFDLIKNSSQIAKALRELHNRGLLRLDSRGMGGRKNFKVVTPR